MERPLYGTARHARGMIFLLIRFAPFLQNETNEKVLEHSSSLRTFKDIEEKCMKAGYLGRKVWEKGPMTPNTRIYTALTWAKTRARRDKSAADWTKSSSEEKSMDKWYCRVRFFRLSSQLIIWWCRIAFNTRWGDTLMPSNAILCANWFSEWNIKGS